MLRVVSKKARRHELSLTRTGFPWGGSLWGGLEKTRQGTEEMGGGGGVQYLGQRTAFRLPFSGRDRYAGRPPEVRKRKEREKKPVKLQRWGRVSAGLENKRGRGKFFDPAFWDGHRIISKPRGLCHYAQKGEGKAEKKEGSR